MIRRDFLKNSLLTAAVPLVASPFTGASRPLGMIERALSTSDKANDHVLVLIQLVGGNDGLNMVIPMETYGNFWISRLSVVVHSEYLLESKTTKRISFHPAMKGVRDLFDDGKVRIINAVGYPEQNFSHFRSMDIWMTGANYNENLSTGWMGRFLKQDFPNYPNVNEVNFEQPPAIITEIQSPVLFQGSSNFGLTVNDPTSDYLLKNRQYSFKTSGKAKDELDFLLVSGELSNGYSKELYQKTNKVIQQKEYPNTSLGKQLKNIARMIASGLKTKVYMATLTGFDTHANQVVRNEEHVGVHANLLRELSDGISAFMADCKYLGIEKRVAGLTFSEFGRRIGANGSLGTDHGAAAPMLAFGEQVLGGIAGDNPAIEKSASAYTSVPMLYDFRSVFSSVLKDWFCVKQNVLEEVFFKNYQYIPIMANFDCLGVTGNEPEKPVDPKDPIVEVTDPNENVVKITGVEKALQEQRLISYPNPFHEKLFVEFESQGGYCAVQLFNQLGQLIKTISQGTLNRGFYKITVDTDQLSDGLYFVRFQNKGFSKINNVIRKS